MLLAVVVHVPPDSGPLVSSLKSEQWLGDSIELISPQKKVVVRISGDL